MYPCFQFKDGNCSEFDSSTRFSSPYEEGKLILIIKHIFFAKARRLRNRVLGAVERSIDRGYLNT